jgi:hypothetical protein
MQILQLEKGDKNNCVLISRAMRRNAPANARIVSSPSRQTIARAIFRRAQHA